MFVWNNGFKVVSNNLQPSLKLVRFLKTYNHYCVASRSYICETLEYIEDEYGFILPENKETSIKEVLRIIQKRFQAYNGEDYNPFVSEFLKALAESIPEKATNKKVA
jgi:hypothetical protein